MFSMLDFQCAYSLVVTDMLGTFTLSVSHSVDLRAFYVVGLASRTTVKYADKIAYFTDCV